MFLGFFVCADVQQLDPVYPLDYEGAVVYNCLLKFTAWTDTESGSKREAGKISRQHSSSVKNKHDNFLLRTVERYPENFLCTRVRLFKPTQEQRKASSVDISENSPQ